MRPLSGECQIVAKEGYRNIPPRQSPRYPVNYGEDQEIEFNSHVRKDIATKVTKGRMKGEAPEAVRLMLGPDGRPVIGADGKMVVDAEFFVPDEVRQMRKSRMKGPLDYDKQCGVINDRGLPCSKSLTCKSHTMGAKRRVQGRSRNYDELLLEWRRATLSSR